MSNDIKYEYEKEKWYILHLIVVAMRNAGLEEAQARIKIAGRNISNFRYADDTMLMAEGKEELKNLLMKVKEEKEKHQNSTPLEKPVCTSGSNN